MKIMNYLFAPTIGMVGILLFERKAYRRKAFKNALTEYRKNAIIIVLKWKGDKIC
jgi:hypothetical protein